MPAPAGESRGRATAEAAPRLRLRPGILAVVVALGLALAMWYFVVAISIPQQINYAALHPTPRGNLSDLYPRWYGAHELLLHGRDPYSAAVTREIQIGYYGRPLDPTRPGDPIDQQGFAYPIYVVFLLWPLLGLPFHVVQADFGPLLLILTAGTVPLWMRAIGWRPGLAATAALMLLTVGSFPVIQGTLLQQLSLLAGVLIAGGAAALAAGRPVLAGVLLALATIKPQVAAPLVAWLALWTVSDWRRRRPLALSFGATMGVLLAGAEIVAPGWIGRFQQALADYQRYTAASSVLTTFLGTAAGLVVTVILLAAMAGICWRVRRAPAGSPGFALALAVALAVTLIVIPTFAPYNQVLLLPGLLLLLSARARLWAAGPLARTTWIFTFGLVAWPWAAAVALTLASLVLPPAAVQAGWTLPLYTSLVIPIGTLAALAALTRVDLRPPAAPVPPALPGAA